MPQFQARFSTSTKKGDQSSCMAKRYATAAAFRKALDDRLRTEATALQQPIETLRKKLAMERLLARLFSSPDVPWLLKGGYAMELRFRPQARATRDIDLTIGGALEDLEERARHETALEALRDAADLDLFDFFVFTIAPAKMDLKGPPQGGHRFTCDATLAGKLYERFHIDVGFGDTVSGDIEELITQDYLGFAGITPGKVRAVSRAQQFAEKLHAYTFPWTGRENTRTKDLVDMLVLLTRDTLKPEKVALAARATFQRRDSHPVPDELSDPPATWKQDFESLTTQVGHPKQTMVEAIGMLREFWKQVQEHL